ncbi:MAG: carbohydrate kinase [Bacteroidetes bacterium]|nr:carbohydrate kinase [Bacteroidota bacterium]
MTKILSYGEVLFDLIEGEAHLGGAPLNFAVNCSRLGADVKILSALGADNLAASAREQIVQFGLSTELIQERSDKATGQVSVSLHNGQPAYSIETDMAYDYISEKEALASMQHDHFDLFYFGSLAQRNGVSRDSLKRIIKEIRFKELFFDCNLRQGFYHRELIEDSLNCATILKLNDEELPIITKLLYHRNMRVAEACCALADTYNLKLLILTAGSEGATVFHKSTPYFVPALPIKVSDTVGAGDAFSAAFAINFLAGLSPKECLEAGNRLGAFVASQRGALPEIPQKLKEDCSP